MTLENQAEYLGNNSWAPTWNEVTEVLGSCNTTQSPWGREVTSVGHMPHW